MRYPTITSLYKYRSLKVWEDGKAKIDKRQIKMIIDEEVWIPSPANFNDPFDCNVRPKFLGRRWKNILKKVIEDRPNHVPEMSDLISKKIEENWSAEDVPDKETIAKIIEFMNEDEFSPQTTEMLEIKLKDSLLIKLQAAIEGVGVFCLSETPDNPLMWAHYADDHRGFCIEYRREPDNILGSDHFSYPVRYSYTYPEVSHSDVYEFELGGSETELTEENIEHGVLGSVMLTKADQWSYEKEWRLIGLGSNLLVEAPGDIKSIIFGLRMPQEDRDLLKSKLGNSLIYKEVKIIEGTFRLEVVYCN